MQSEENSDELFVMLLAQYSEPTHKAIQQIFGKDNDKDNTTASLA